MSYFYRDKFDILSVVPLNHPSTFGQPFLWDQDLSFKKSLLAQKTKAIFIFFTRALIHKYIWDQKGDTGSLLASG